MKLATIAEAGRRDFLKSLAGNLGTGNDGDGGLLGKQNRRDFLKRTGGIAAAAATNANPVLGAAKTAMGAGGVVKGLFDDVSDDELLEMPEQKWLSKISPARAFRIARENPEHGANEAISKIVKVISYGALRMTGHDRDVSGRGARVAQDASKALLDISHRWKLSQSELMDKASNMGYFHDAKSASQFGDFIRKNARKYGIRTDLGNKKHSAETEEQEDDIEHAPPKPEASHHDDQDDHDLHRWADDGGANFESRLSRALGVFESRRR